MLEHIHLKTAFIQTRTVDLDAANNYTIKLIDNDLIVETQVTKDDRKKNMENPST